MELSEYDIKKITYKRGQYNCDADLLSRFPYDDDYNQNHDDESLDYNRFSDTKRRLMDDPIQINVITRSKTKITHAQPSSPIPQMSPLPSTSTANDGPIDHRTISLSMDRIRMAQAADEALAQHISSVQNQPDQHPNEMIENGILFKKISHNNGHITTIPWLPSSLIPDVLFLYHDHPMSGHLGITRTFHKIRQQFYFHHMYDSIKRYIRSCAACARCNVQRRKKPGFLQRETPPEGVFEVMQMDFWKAPIRSSQGNLYVLILTDRLSKFVFACAFPSATSRAAAEMLFENIILVHGAIRCLQSDQRSHFRNELLNAFTKMTGCEHAFSIPYHPMSNGQVERFNSTFCDQLKNIVIRIQIIGISICHQSFGRTIQPSMPQQNMFPMNWLLIAV